MIYIVKICAFAVEKGSYSVGGGTLQSVKLEQNSGKLHKKARQGGGCLGKNTFLTGSRNEAHNSLTGSPRQICGILASVISTPF